MCAVGAAQHLVVDIDSFLDPNNDVLDLGVGVDVSLAVLLAVQELLLFGGIHHLNFQPPRRPRSSFTAHLNTLRELFKDLTLDGTEVLPVASCATVGNVNLRYFATPFPAQRNRFSQLRCLVQVAAGPIRQGRGNRGRQSSRTHGGKTDERQKQLQAAGMKTKPRAHGGHPQIGRAHV